MEQQPDHQTLKMEALKKAYAEIILNTSTEAAARAMASEHKALRCQYDLRNTKDEALRMLLRFKHIIDSKTSETEKANLGQQKRIEELDAQLNEAEGVIVDLRAELRNAYERLEEMKKRHRLQSSGPSENEDMIQENTTNDKKLEVIEELEEMKSTDMQPSNGPSENEHVDQEKTAHDKKLDVTGRLEEIKNNYMVQSTGTSESNCIYQENTGHPKKLYIAKRLEATEKNHMQQSDGPSENEQTHQENSALDKKLAISSSLPKLASIVNGNREPESYRNGCTQRIRAIERNLMDEKNISEDKHDIDKKVSGKCVPASIVAEVTDTKSINRPDAVSINSSVVKDQAVKIKRFPRNRVRYGKSKRKVSRFCNPQSIKSTKRNEKLSLKENTHGKDEKLTGTKESGIRRSIRKRKVRCWDEISSLFKSRTALSRCKKYSGNDGVNFDGQPISKFTDASKETKCDDGSKLVDVSVVGKHEIAAQSAGVSSRNSSAKAEKVLKTDSEQARNTDKGGLLKYTFSRKRKNVLSSKSDNCSSLEKSLLTRENEKLNIIDDSSDNQNLVEVACQLISLSGGNSW